MLKDVLGFEVIGLNWLFDAVIGVSELVMVKVVQVAPVAPVAQVALVALLSEKFLGMSTQFVKGFIREESGLERRILSVGAASGFFRACQREVTCHRTS